MVFKTGNDNTEGAFKTVPGGEEYSRMGLLGKITCFNFPNLPQIPFSGSLRYWLVRRLSDVGPPLPDRSYWFTQKKDHCFSGHRELKKRGKAQAL